MEREDDGVKIGRLARYLQVLWNQYQRLRRENFEVPKSHRRHLEEMKKREESSKHSTEPTSDDLHESNFEVHAQNPTKMDDIITDQVRDYRATRSNFSPQGRVGDRGFTQTNGGQNSAIINQSIPREMSLREEYHIGSVPENEETVVLEDSVSGEFDYDVRSSSDRDDPQNGEASTVYFPPAEASSDESHPQTHLHYERFLADLHSRQFQDGAVDRDLNPEQSILPEFVGRLEQNFNHSGPFISTPHTSKSSRKGNDIDFDSEYYGNNVIKNERPKSLIKENCRNPPTKRARGKEASIQRTHQNNHVDVKLGTQSPNIIQHDSLENISGQMRSNNVPERSTAHIQESKILESENTRGKNSPSIFQNHVSHISNADKQGSPHLNTERDMKDAYIEDVQNSCPSPWCETDQNLNARQTIDDLLGCFSSSQENPETIPIHITEQKTHTVEQQIVQKEKESPERVDTGDKTCDCQMCVDTKQRNRQHYRAKSEAASPPSQCSTSLQRGHELSTPVSAPTHPKPVGRTYKYISQDGNQILTDSRPIGGIYLEEECPPQKRCQSSEWASDGRGFGPTKLNEGWDRFVSDFHKHGDECEKHSKEKTTQTRNYGEMSQNYFTTCRCSHVGHSRNDLTLNPQLDLPEKYREDCEKQNKATQTSNHREMPKSSFTTCKCSHYQHSMKDWKLKPQGDQPEKHGDECEKHCKDTQTQKYGDMSQSYFTTCECSHDQQSINERTLKPRGDQPEKHGDKCKKHSQETQTQKYGDMSQSYFTTCECSHDQQSINERTLKLQRDQPEIHGDECKKQSKETQTQNYREMSQSYFTTCGCSHGQHSTNDLTLKPQGNKPGQCVIIKESPSFPSRDKQTDYFQEALIYFASCLQYMHNPSDRKFPLCQKDAEEGLKIARTDKRLTRRESNLRFAFGVIDETIHHILSVTSRPQLSSPERLEDVRGSLCTLRGMIHELADLAHKMGTSSMALQALKEMRKLQKRQVQEQVHPPDTRERSVKLDVPPIPCLEVLTSLEQSIICEDFPSEKLASMGLAGLLPFEKESKIQPTKIANVRLQNSPSDIIQPEQSFKVEGQIIAEVGLGCEKTNRNNESEHFVSHKKNINHYHDYHKTSRQKEAKKAPKVCVQRNSNAVPVISFKTAKSAFSRENYCETCKEPYPIVKCLRFVTNGMRGNVYNKFLRLLGATLSLILVLLATSNHSCYVNDILEEDIMRCFHLRHMGVPTY